MQRSHADTAGVDDRELPCPVVALRDQLASLRPTSPGFGIGTRRRTHRIPGGNAVRRASSPKSLSKVSKMRSSLAAHAKTSGSAMPGAAVLIQTTSCPATRRAVTAAPGKFSLERERISGCAAKYFLRTQRVAGIGKASDEVVVHDPWVIGQNIAFAPTVGHQADHELDRKPGAVDDGLAGEHVRIECNARMLGHH